MPPAPHLRLSLDQPFKDALKAVIFAYTEMGEVRLDEVGMVLTDLEDYVRKLHNLKKNLARGVRFRVYDHHGTLVGEPTDPEQLIRLHRRGYRITMLGVPDHEGLEVRWSG